MRTGVLNNQLSIERAESDGYCALTRFRFELKFSAIAALFFMEFADGTNNRRTHN
jgi:hypothetical protein